MYSESGVLYLFVGLWFVFGFVCASIWRGKGGSYGVGFLIGLLLGIIGLVIVLVIRPSGSSASPGAPAVAGASITRECPFCKSQIAPDAIVCRVCQRESEPWHSIEGKAWVAVDEAGQEHWLDTTGRQWFRVRRTDACPHCGAAMSEDESVCSACRTRSSKRIAGVPFLRRTPSPGMPTPGPPQESTFPPPPPSLG